MPYLRPFRRSSAGAKCRLLVLVRDSDYCPVEEFLRTLAREAPTEFRQLTAVLGRALAAGPRSLHNEKLCKHVGGSRSGVFEFRARSGLARILWFRAAAVHGRGIETIVLVSGFREKQVQQAEIATATRTRAACLSSPFELRGE